MSKTVKETNRQMDFQIYWHEKHLMLSANAHLLKKQIGVLMRSIDDWNHWPNWGVLHLILAIVPATLVDT
jgi:hypothetical protein